MLDSINEILKTILNLSYLFSYMSMYLIVRSNFSLREKGEEI